MLAEYALLGAKRTTSKNTEEDTVLVPTRTVQLRKKSTEITL